MYLITPSQCRAARALLNWSQPDLAQRCGMHVQTISAFESEGGTPTKTTLEKIITTFDTAGIEFLSGEGVRKRIQEIITYTGIIGLGHFIWDVYRTVEKHGGEVCVSNVDEHVFISNLEQDTLKDYIGKMTALKAHKNFNFKILVKEDDLYLPGSDYAEYRWIEKKYFHATPFYVYGDKLAMINFQKGPTVHVIENQDMADSQRTQFNLFWKHAKIPPAEAR